MCVSEKRKNIVFYKKISFAYNIYALQVDVEEMKTSFNVQINNMKPIKPKGKKNTNAAFKSYNSTSIKERKLISTSSIIQKAQKQDNKKREKKIPPLPHKIINELLHGFNETKTASSALNVTNHAFHSLEQLIKHMPEPYPELFKHVEEPLRESIYHHIQINKPYFYLLPKFKQEEKEAMEEDTKWKQRCADAKARNEELKMQYKNDQETALMLKERLADSTKVEHNLQRTLEDLTATQDEALKQLDIVKDRVRNAKVERDRQAKALYDARKKHENITNDLKTARQQLSNQHQETNSALVPASAVKVLYQEIEEVKNTIKAWEEKRDNMRKWHAESLVAHENMKIYEKKLKNDTDIMLQQHEIFKRSYTPRPDWDKVLDTTPELFQALRMEKFSDLMLHLQTGEASESSDSSSADDEEGEGEAGNEEDRDLETEKKLDSLVERKKRARKRARERAKQFHHNAKLDERDTHQAHHIHHLHHKHKKEHKRRRQNAKVNRRLSAVSI